MWAPTTAQLLADPFYLGYRERRLRGAPYDAFIEEFVQAVKNVFPRALLQWEDFKKANALSLLGRYAGRLPSFNDDIQGTAAVALAGILSALRIVGQPLREQRFLMVGSGAAGVGIGRLVHSALLAEGMTDQEIRRAKIFIDSCGLVCDSRENLDAHKRAIALRPDDMAALGLSNPPPRSLEEIVRVVKPTVLIGTTGHPGDFTAGCCAPWPSTVSGPSFSH